MKMVLGLTRPYRTRLILGILCGFIAGLSNPLLMGSVKLVFEVAFPQPGAPTLGERLQGLSLLSGNDLKDLPGLIRKFKQRADPVSERLWSEFQPEAQQLLVAPKATLAEQQTVLVEELNRAIQAEASRYPDGFRLDDSREAMYAGRGE